MAGNRTFAPGDPYPSDNPNSLGEFLGASAHNFLLRIKPSAATMLQVVAGPGNAEVSIAINGRWRYVSANVERTSPGGATPRTLDVYVTASDNSFAPSGGGEVDSTDYSFGLAIVESGAAPVGVALSRKVATAVWDGTKFTALDVLLGAQAGASRHAGTHAAGGPDELTPEAIDAVRDDPTWTAYTPTMRTSGDTPTLGAGNTLVGRRKLLAGVCFFEIELLVNASTFSGGTGSISFDLPFASNADARQVVPCLLRTVADSRWWQGIGRIIGGQSVVFPMFPDSDVEPGLDDLQNAQDSAHLVGTGVPAQPGAHFPLEPGASLIISGSYRV